MDSDFERLRGKLRDISTLSQIDGLLGWDEQVNLPEASTAARGRQMALLAKILYEHQTDPALGTLIENLLGNADALSEEQMSIVKDAHSDFKETLSLNADFVSRRAQAMSNSYHAWAKAHESGDFETFAPYLSEQIALAQEYAVLCGAEDAYDFWIDKHDPGMDAAKIHSLFVPLREELPPILQSIAASSFTFDESIFRGFDEGTQEQFLKEVLAKLGFDFKRGRIDRSIHPFCSGSGEDVRMTTRFFEDNPLDSLFSSIHEAGHGMYEQGLPTEWTGTLLGKDAGMGAHESQSRLWENQVSRSRAFWEYWEPIYRDKFSSQLAGIDSDTLYKAINAVRTIPIRVDSDEVSYNLHIIMRFELERDLFSGALAVKDLPEAWNSLAKELLGLDIADNKNGCLQDVHWSGGAFGYFPSYTLGNMLAAQLWYKMRADIPEIDGFIAKGSFDPILSWLRDHVHRHGRRYPLLELTERSTGQPLSHEALIRYLKERYLTLFS